MNLSAAFGIVLRRLRTEKKVSQEELAAQSGFHRTYISLLERGKKSPSLNTIFKLSSSLGLPLKDFMSMVEKEIKDLNKIDLEQ